MLSELFLRYSVVPQDNFYKHLSFYETTIAADVIAFGDSRMSQGFSPEQEEMVNFSYAGESFEQIAEKISITLDQKAVNKILLQISPHMFASYRFDSDKRDYSLFFTSNAPWKSMLYLQDPVLRGQLLDLLKSRVFPQRKGVSQSIFNTNNGAITNEYTMIYPLTPAGELYTHTRMAEHALDEKYKTRETWQIMRETIRMIKEKNIDLCLVSFPVTRVYNKAIIKTPYIDDALERLKNIAEEEKVLYINHRDLYSDQYSFFRNLDHLNARGAKEFSAKIIEDCGF